MLVKVKNKLEKGQSLIELAAALFVLLLIIGGIVDLGRAIFTLFSMQDAAEEGVVFGVAFPTHCDQIVERVRYNLTNEVLPDDIAVSVVIKNNSGVWQSCDTIPFAEVFASKPIRVLVTQSFDITMPFIGAFIGQQIPLNASANGIILRPQPEPTPTP